MHNILYNFHTWEKDAREFKGDKALFWAGKMSEVAYRVINARATDLSYYVQLLDQVRVHYDDEIFSRVERGGTREDI